MRHLLFEAVETVEVQNGGLVTVALFRCGPPGEMLYDENGCFVGTRDECARYLNELSKKREWSAAHDDGLMEHDRERIRRRRAGLPQIETCAGRKALRSLPKGRALGNR